MTMYSLAKKNIKRNLQQYLLYLYSMVFSIVIFYTFTSLKNNQQLLQQTTTLHKIEPAFSAASVILIIFAAIFILYSNAFFTRMRKKEVGLYALVGMTKKQIGKLLFYENVVIGLLALMIGIMVGTILTRLFVMMIIKVMGFSVIAEFTISVKSILQTIIVFLIIILFTSFRSFRLIYKFTLVELFKADKKGEKPPKASIYKNILSMVMLGSGYAILLQPSDSTFWDVTGSKFIFVSLVLIIIGTYLFISSSVIYILNFMRKKKKIFYNSINMISITHLLYRIRSNVFTLTIISLLTAFTLFFLSTTYSFYFNATELTKKVSPFSYMYSSNNEIKDQEIHDLIEMDENHPVIYNMRVEYLEVQGDLSQIKRVRPDIPLNLFSESTYREILDRIDKGVNQPISKNGAVAFYDGNLDAKADPYTGKKIAISNEYQLEISSYMPFSITNSRMEALPLVVSDELYSELKRSAEAKYYQIYKVKNEKDSKVLTEKIEKVLYQGEPLVNNIKFLSFYNEYFLIIQTYGILIFIGSFLGIVFLLATGSTIYFKQVTEALVDKERYQVLTKIGMAKNEIKWSIVKQNLFIFLLPFLVAVAHSVVIVIAITNFVNMNMMIPTVICLSIYFIIYSIYFILTNIKYNQIVGRKRKQVLI